MTNLEKVEYKVTDLEALEMIVSDLTPIAKEHNKEEIEQVKKSLEVLEIIKNHILDVGKYINGGIYLKFHYGNYNPYYTIEIKDGINKLVSTEEYSKIMEGLKNE